MTGYKIPFSARSHQYTDEECKLVVDVMRNASPLTQGVYLEEFEKKFQQYIGVGHAFAVTNATSALELAAQLCNFGSGDEVIAPAHTFTSSVYPFAKNGAEVVWADIDLRTRVVGVEQIQKCITSKTKAVVIPHLYGYLADMPEIIDLAKKSKILVIEDVAQAIGAELEGCMAGAFGDISVFSFHAQKNISSLGEGGVIVVRGECHAKILPMLRHNGHCKFGWERDDYWLPAMGNLEIPEIDGTLLWPSNYCLGEVECALAARLLDRVAEINELKRDRAISFIDKLNSFPELDFHRESTRRHNYHLLVARLTNGSRDEFIRRMADRYGVQCAVQYYPLYRYPFYKRLGFDKAECPNTDLFFDNMISFPFSHSLTSNQLNYMVESSKQVLDSISK